jgi:hypothetical protein
LNYCFLNKELSDDEYKEKYEKIKFGEKVIKQSKVKAVRKKAKKKKKHIK